MDSPIAVEPTIAFLRRHAPWNRVAEDLLRGVVPRMRAAHFARDSTILSSRSGPVADLVIIERGLVGSRPNTAQSVPDRTLGPGELFPVGALSAGGATTRIFHAIEDTACLLLPRADFLALRQASPEFERYCTQAITETLKQSLESLYGQYSQRVTEQQTLTRTLGELIRHPPVSCRGDRPLSEAASRMSEANVRTIVVLGEGDRPVGMFTLVDLLKRVVLAERSLSTPLAEVMTSPIVTLSASATAYEALNVMAEKGIRQVVVVDGGRLRGVINERDLFALQRVTMRQVVEELQAADGVDRLKIAAADIRLFTQNLLAQGVAAEPLTRTIASLNDALSRRAIEIVLGAHDLAGIDWCWLALGSEGRGEQTFATDQDNAILFAAEEGTGDAARKRLLAFAREVNEALDALGFPLCTGNVMASNPDLCLSLPEWKAKFLKWIREPTPEALLQANILFDFRPLFGNSTLAESLRSWLFGYTRDNNVFLRLMVQNALEAEPPIGLIRAFTVDDDVKEAPGTIDLKVRGTRIFVDAARVFALAQGIAEPGTADRLRIAGQRLRVEPRHVEATVEAFHFLQLLRLRQQDAPTDGGTANRIDPYALNDVAQRMLKEAFRQAKQLQERLRLSYRL
jgi:CBS domain-containing protein